MVTNVAFDDYMANETKWNAFIRGVDAAKTLGMSLWLYDECGYPSGAAGGLTLRGHPEYEARGLNIADARVEGGTLTLTAPPGTLFRAVAVPIRDGQAFREGAIDLSSFVKDGALVWEAPPGAWHVFIMTEDSLYDGTHCRQPRLQAPVHQPRPAGANRAFHRGHPRGICAPPRPRSGTLFCRNVHR